MKKMVLLIFALFFASLCFAQYQVIKAEFPQYQGIVDIKGKTKDESYPKIKAWVATNFASANDVIQLDDKDAGKMIVKGNMVVYGETMGIKFENRVYFALTIDVKDDRFRYTYEVSDVTSGANSMSIMSDMTGRLSNKKVVVQLKEDIDSKFRLYMADIRKSIMNDTNDDW